MNQIIKEMISNDRLVEILNEVPPGTPVHFLTPGNPRQRVFIELQADGGDGPEIAICLVEGTYGVEVKR